MNKEFIPYQQSLELRKLGFDEECLAITNVNTYELKIIYENYHKELYLPTPLYSQAFRWFREKGYRFTLSSDYETGLYYFDVWYNTQFMFETNYQYQTYEEAEFACLKKLIEIVKQK